MYFRPKLYVLIGVSGSGKSTYAETLKDESLAIVSTDAIRREMLGNEADQSNGEEVFRSAYFRINQHLSMEQDVVFDATNTTAYARKQLIGSIQESCRKVAVLVIPELDVSLARNLNRERKVPENVIRRQYAQLIRDGESILNQFDDIIFVKGA